MSAAATTKIPTAAERAAAEAKRAALLAKAKAELAIALAKVAAEEAAKAAAASTDDSDEDDDTVYCNDCGNDCADFHGYCQKCRKDLCSDCAIGDEDDCVCSGCERSRLAYAYPNEAQIVAQVLHTIGDAGIAESRADCDVLTQMVLEAIAEEAEVRASGTTANQ